MESQFGGMSSFLLFGRLGGLGESLGKMKATGAKGLTDYQARWGPSFQLESCDANSRCSWSGFRLAPSTVGCLRVKLKGAHCKVALSSWNQRVLVCAVALAVVAVVVLLVVVVEVAAAEEVGSRSSRNCSSSSSSSMRSSSSSSLRCRSIRLRRRGTGSGSSSRRQSGGDGGGGGGRCCSSSSGMKTEPPRRLRERAYWHMS